jgi:hypothetical protein
MRGLDRCGTTLNEYMSGAIFLWAEEDEKEPTLHIFSSGLKLCLSQRGAHHRRIRCCMRVNQWGHGIFFNFFFALLAALSTAALAGSFWFCCWGFP